MRRGDQPAGFRTVLMHKDLELALEQAAAFQLSLPLGAQAASRFGAAIRAGRGDEDAAVVAEIALSQERTHE